MISIVIIGRNEGERLARCLHALRERGTVVYVDSGSTDGSVELARSCGAHVVNLDMSHPFTAARARNAGFEAVVQLRPQTRFVQFVDGDCEMTEGWLELAAATLDSDPKLAVVCGRLRERHPEASVYNRLCDVEWDGPVGEVSACGGIAMMRVEAFAGIGGFDPTLIAGEEPDLCLRLRRQGWRIRRLGAEMATHDAAMLRFSQWWKRTARGGYAYAKGAAMHGRGPERHWVRETRRALLWGAIVPAVAVVGAPATLGTTLLLLAAYPLTGWRAARAASGRGRKPREAAEYGLFCTIGKFAEARGVLRYLQERWTASPSELIEYKQAPKKSAPA